MGGKSTCIFACLQCERSICLKFHHFKHSHTLYYLHTQGIKVLKWIFFFVSYKNKIQHFDFTIKVTQSFCFYICPCVYVSVFLFHFDYEIQTLDSERKKSNHNLFPSMCVYMNRVLLRVLRNICYLLHTYLHTHTQHTLIRTHTEKKINNRHEDLYI